MDAETRTIRDRVMALSKGRSALSRRYPADLRQAVVELTRRRVASGETVGRVAHDLQITWKTLADWLSKHKPEAKLRPVRVAPVRVAPQRALAPVLVTAQGVRIEGLDIASLAELVRALS